MDWKWKMATIGMVVFVVALMFFIIMKQYELLEKQRVIENDVIEMRRLAKDIVRAQSRYATSKDIDKILKDQKIDANEIKKDIKRLDAKLTSVVTTRVVTPGFIGTGIASTSTTPGPATNDPTVLVDCKDGKAECPNLDKHGFLQNRQVLRLDEPFSSDKTIPFGSVGFSAWQDKPWDLNIFPRNYRTTTVISENEDGRQFAHTEMSVEVDGKKYTMPIQNSEIVQKYPESHFMFNPRVYIGVDVGVKANPPAHSEGSVNLSVPLFSRGKTKKESDWTFVGIGAGYQFHSKSLGVVATPITYNLGNHLPVIDDLHIGPSVALDPSLNVSVMAGLRVGM